VKRLLTIFRLCQYGGKVPSAGGSVGVVIAQAGLADVKGVLV
jgi:hypothetical protein